MVNEYGTANGCLICHLENDSVKIALGFEEIFCEDPCHIEEFATITVPCLPVIFIAFFISFFLDIFLSYEIQVLPALDRRLLLQF